MQSESSEQVCEGIADALHDIRLEWVENPECMKSPSHRLLSRCANELTMITSAMKEYGRSSNKVERGILEAVLNYGLKAHELFSTALNEWLAQNPESFARDKIKKLMSRFPERESEHLRRYYSRACKDPLERSVWTASQLSDPVSQLPSDVSVEPSQLQKQREEILKLSSLNQMMELSAEESKMNLEFERKKHELELRKKNKELEVLKSIAEAATNATDVLEFNDARERYSQVVVPDKAPTGGPELPGQVFVAKKEVQERYQGVSGERYALKGGQTLIKPKVCTYEGSSKTLQPNTSIPRWIEPDQYPKDEERNRYDQCYIPLSLERELMNESGGLRFSGDHMSEYPAFRHRFLLRYRQLREKRPDLLLRWIEATIVGRAKRYINSAFLIPDDGSACDIAWENLEEVYGRRDQIMEESLRSVKRPTKSVSHNRETLLDLRADMRSLEGVARSLGCESALKNPELIGNLYCSLDDDLRRNLEFFLPPDQWTFWAFIEFLSKEISYVDCLHEMKIKQDVRPTTQSRVKTNFNQATSRGGRKEATRIACNEILREDATSKRQFCVLHPESSQHSLAACRTFRNLSVTERWDVCRRFDLCFNCFKKDHQIKACTQTRCEKCKKFHHSLLHDDDWKPKHELPTASLSTQECSNTQSTVVSTGGKLEQIGIMRLTAVRRNDRGGICERIPFYAAVDTGATRTLCSRDLGEQLFRWSPTDHQQYKMFNGQLVDCEAATGSLEVETSDGNTQLFTEIHFINQVLPFSEFLRNDEKLPRRIDMVLGSDYVWEHLFDPLCKQGISLTTNKVVSVDIGMFWLSSKTNPVCSGVNGIAAALQPAISANDNKPFHPVEQKTLSKVRLSRQDREDDLRNIESDPMHVSYNDDKLTMSIQDEAILTHYADNVKEVQLENGETHLQFKFPWIANTNTMPNNKSQASNALVRL